MMSIHPQTIGSLLREKKEQHPAHEAIVYPERSLRIRTKRFIKRSRQQVKVSWH